MRLVLPLPLVYRQGNRSPAKLSNLLIVIKLAIDIVRNHSDLLDTVSVFLYCMGI